jgi:hypothetical protein
VYGHGFLGSGEQAGGLMQHLLAINSVSKKTLHFSFFLSVLTEE